jgi:hypothetical protein
VGGVDGEELALDVRGEVVDPLDGIDGRVVLTEGWLLDDPLKVGLDGHVETGVGVLAWNDTVDGRVAEAGTIRDAAQSVLWGVLWVLDEASKGVGGSDGVLAGNDRDGGLSGTLVDTLGNDGSDELENVWADGTGDLVVC